VSTSALRGGRLARRCGVVVAAGLSVGLLGAVAPAPVTVPANAETTTSTTSTAGAGAGAVTATTAATVEDLGPVVASTVGTSTSSRLATTSRTTSRAPVVAPYRFGTKGYNKWWARYYMAKKYGWKSSSQWQCLNNLWARESGWSHKAHNRYSGAHGIPQALPGSKMAVYGKDWRWNPRTQIKWGLSYVKGRYGTPCGAWAAFNRKGWY
jgi:hypothetical protein